ncbi:Gfo/Idh/MocA family oxidoreductase [Magnetospirillum sulfuroxidans]|uniref:Gfo/Idh/MocA family oxidoreductase n=1 Tax=Magnetospirillum sulfuroxidans TaxID=611300 RepID=A0ABS5IH49_9PROT|nr:Gfo/Idh/MocA family oxidoreductase [Magnetospirillum sulfuroxidans]MBR9973669.1 Gfo/Idh/MocA family oxidoreductase [Magnetospirillum sulfuroxidans]
MSLTSLMAERVSQGRPVRIGLIGAGKFASLFLAQARHQPALHVVAIADENGERAHTALALAAWPPAKAVARSVADALQSGGTWVGCDPMALFEHSGLDVVIEASGSATAAAAHAVAALDNGIHVIMASIEADALVGPFLAQRAKQNGLIYSLAYGDQPALICELVDWARACGFEIAAAGRGIAWMPGHHSITPHTVWPHLGLSSAQAKAKDLDPYSATATLDGTRAALELASTANATGLTPAATGLNFPPCGTHDLPHIFRPSEAGGRLPHLGMVEAASCLETDGRAVVGGLRWGVFVTFTTPAAHAALSFAEYGLLTDDSGNYAARWRPHRLAGLEAAVSVGAVCLRGEHTGCPRAHVADVATIAKRDLKAAEELDGIGGHTVRGQLMPAAQARVADILPISLARGAVLRRPIAAGQPIALSDVILPAQVDPLLDMRRQMAS